jgi:hypothetical protein
MAFGNSNFGFSGGGGGGGGTPIVGGGTLDYIPKFNPNGTTIGDSSLFDNGVSIGLNTNTPNASAAFDIISTTQGLLIPRMTQTQRDAIASPALSLFIFNTTSAHFNFWNGSTWLVIESSTITSDTLSQVLAAGNTTGGLPIVMTSGDTLNFSVGSGGSLNSLTTTAPRTWNLPDASGTIALISNIPSTAITLNVIPKGTGTGIADGSWQFSINDILPTTTGSNIGDATHRIGTIFMASVFDYINNLTFYNGTSTTMTLTTGGSLGIGGSPDPSYLLDVFGNVAIETNYRLKFISALPPDVDAGTIAANLYTSGLDIVGTSGDSSYRKLQLWGEITQNENGGLNTFLGTTYFNGNVGVGKPNPQARLHVSGGGVQIGDSGDDQSLVFGGTNASIIWGNPASGASISYNVGSLYFSSVASLNAMVLQSTTGNVGVGTISPLNRLSVNGNIEITTNANTLKFNNTTILAVSQGVGATNIMLGRNASGIDSGNGGFISIGDGASSVDDGIAIGLNSSCDSSSSDSIAIGRSALVSGGVIRGIAIGRNANAAFSNSFALGFNTTTTDYNQYLYGDGTVRYHGFGGVTAANTRVTITGRDNTSTQYGLIVQDSVLNPLFVVRNDGNVYAFGGGNINTNAAFGLNALVSNTTGGNNVAMGYGSQQSGSTNGNNTSVGSLSLNVNSGNYMSSFGRSNLSNNSTGEQNTSFGAYGMYQNTSGSMNTAIGMETLFSNISGSFNTALGYYAGYSSIGDGNVFIGYKAGYFETGSNLLFIANSDVLIPLIGGNFTTGDVGIGLAISSLKARFHNFGVDSTTNINQRLEPVSGVTEDTLGATINTTDATANVILQSLAISTGTVQYIVATINYKKTAGAGVGSVGQGTTFKISASIQNIGGTLTIDTVQNDYTGTVNAIAGVTATLLVSGTNINVVVTGVLNDTIKWDVITKIIQ